jgi:ketosteroid isomerase-like protein
MTNKEIIMQVIDAFDTGNSGVITGHMTNDAEWYFLGDQAYIGLESIKKFFNDHKEVKVTSSIKNHIIVDGDTIAVSGEIACTTSKGILCDMYYCDIYEMEKFKIKKLTSYTVDKKK